MSSYIFEKSRKPEKSILKKPSEKSLPRFLDSDKPMNVDDDSASHQAQATSFNQEDLSGVKWDEETIAEHDKERGTRQKIDEPKTPYSKPDYRSSDDEEGSSSKMMECDDSSDLEGHSTPRGHSSHHAHFGTRHKSDESSKPTHSVSADEIQQKIDQLKDKRDDVMMLNDSSESDDDEDPEEKAKRKAFAAKRKQHYDEFKRMKQLMSQDHSEDSSSDSD